MKVLVAIDRYDTAPRGVMGMHGRGPAGAVFLGSVAHRVAHLAPMPVTLVR